MAIIEKRIILNSKSSTAPSVSEIENAIIQSGLKPVRWAIVDINENQYTILANGVEKGI